jgi:hypothetical protein
VRAYIQRMTHKALEELMRALAREATTQGIRMVVDFPSPRLLEAEGVEVPDDVVPTNDHHIANISIAPDQQAAQQREEIVAVRKIPNGVHFTFRSGASRGLLGVSLEEAQREVGRIGDKVPKRRFVRVTGPAPEPPVTTADLKKPPK